MPAGAHSTASDLLRWATAPLDALYDAVLVISLVVFLVVEAALLLLPAFAGNGFVLAGILGLALLWWLFVLRRRLQVGDARPQYARDHPDSDT